MLCYANKNLKLIMNVLITGLRIIKGMITISLLQSMRRLLRDLKKAALLLKEFYLFLIVKLKEKLNNTK